MSTYPVTPTPSRITEEQGFWPAVMVEFERIIRHVRPLFGHRIRKVTLFYQNLTQADFDMLKNFFSARKGRNERFTFTHPDPNQSSVSFKARFAENKLSWKHHSEDVDRYDLTLGIHESP